MRRGWLILAFAVALSTWAWAQEGEHAAPAKESGHATEAQHEDESKYDVWKWVNFGILAVGLGYMLGKALPPFFQGRTADIQKGISDAAKLKAEAEQRAADMERRIASLESEIAQIRAEASAVMAKEGDRIGQEAEQHVARIQAQAEQEVAAATKHASEQLKAHAAALALDLAEQRIRSSVNEGTQGTLVDRFLRQLNDQKGQGVPF